jgi:hypothetical protein
MMMCALRTNDEMLTVKLHMRRSVHHSGAAGTSLRSASFAGKRQTSFWYGKRDVYEKRRNGAPVL